jgi:hypothetical protein
MPMNLSEVAGNYEETGTWKSSDGKSGDLDGGTLGIKFENNKIEIVYPDDEVQVSEAIDSFDTPIPITGKLSSGHVLVGGCTLILEYKADIEGRVEQNTDIWVFRDNVVTRHGVIRQDDRIIWFEATMNKVSS